MDLTGLADSLPVVVATSLTTAAGWALGRRERNAKVRQLEANTEVASGDLILRWAERLEAQLGRQSDRLSRMEGENTVLREHVWLLTQQLVNAGIVPAPPPPTGPAPGADDRE